MCRLTIALAAATMLLATAAPAVAVSNVAVLEDPVGDVTIATGDMRRARLGHGRMRITLSMTLKGWADPLTSAEWTQGYTGPYWLLDTRGDIDNDYQVNVFSNGNRLVGKVIRVRHGVPDAGTLCRGTATGDAETRKITFVFDRSCIGSPDRARFYAYMYWDTEPENPGNDPQRDTAYGPYGDATYSSWATVPSS